MFQRDNDVKYVAQTCDFELAGHVVAIAATDSGVCGVSVGTTEEEAVGLLREDFPNAQHAPEDVQILSYLSAVIEITRGQKSLNIPLDLRGTAFQLKVWKELAAIPFGETRSYTEVAESIGSSGAVRAVANACAANPVSLIVPCHRVIKSDGTISGYRWGRGVKEVLLRLEGAWRGGGHSAESAL